MAKTRQVKIAHSLATCKTAESAWRWASGARLQADHPSAARGVSAADRAAAVRGTAQRGLSRRVHPAQGVPTWTGHRLVDYLRRVNPVIGPEATRGVCSRGPSDQNEGLA